MCSSYCKVTSGLELIRNCIVSEKQVSFRCDFTAATIVMATDYLLVNLHPTTPNKVIKSRTKKLLLIITS